MLYDAPGEKGSGRAWFVCVTLNFTSREFKKLRRLLQRKRQIKKDLQVRLIALRLFSIGHNAQNKRGALSLAWHECFSFKGGELRI